MHHSNFRRIACASILLVFLLGCTPSNERTPAVVRAELLRKLPSNLADRAGWAQDIHAAFTALHIEPSSSNLCAALSVIEQESTYRVDPPVPGLDKIARAEIERRAKHFHIPDFLLKTMLNGKSANGKTYDQRLREVKTEQELSAIFDDMISRVPLGSKLLAGMNPIRTGGAMQVRISFAQAHAKNYPYPINGTIRQEVFSRRGGIYFGIKHLLGYPTRYTKPIYHFADFNAGWYASRNAAFQRALSIASNRPLILDGDLLTPETKMSEPGATESAVRSLSVPLGLDDKTIRQILTRSRSFGFQETALYLAVFQLAEQKANGPLMRARVPDIELNSPKITRKLTTAWFAERVNTRWKSCMQK